MVFFVVLLGKKIHGHLWKRCLFVCSLRCSQSHSIFLTVHHLLVGYASMVQEKNPRKTVTIVRKVLGSTLAGLECVYMDQVMDKASTVTTAERLLLNCCHLHSATAPLWFKRMRLNCLLFHKPSNS